MSEQGKYGEPWSFDGMGNLIDCHGERIATGYDNGETCIDHDDRVRVCINTCAPLGEDPAAEIAAKDARIAELEAESTRLNRIVNLWDKACDIAESHLQSYVNVGDSLFNGIPKLVADRDKALFAWSEMTVRCDELRSALAASKAREGEAERLLERGLCVWPDAESAYDQIKWEDDARAFLKERQ